MNIDALVEKIAQTVETHRIEEGVYARWIWQNAEHPRQLGKNEYGCADAANILYTIGRFPQAPEAREKWIDALRSLQDPETGLFREATHHMIHTTAHCLAALELFDAQPLYPLTALEPYLDKARMIKMLDSLDWESSPWAQSHRGAGLYAALAITRMVDLDWQRAYFDYLRTHCDPQVGMSQRHGSDSLCHHMCGWFHYLFNHEYAKQPIPYPEKLIDTCIDMYLDREEAMKPAFGRIIGFMEIDWVFCMHRASRQTAHRRDEVKQYLREFAADFIAWLESLDVATHEGFNDLHALFGMVCALAELQLALPGEIETTVPLKIVLDRRPFI